MNDFEHTFFNNMYDNAWGSINEDAKNNHLRVAVTNIMLELGIPANIKGYFYLREAIIIKVNNPEILIPLTKVLYPGIAEIFNTSPAQVERAIRHAISIAWIRGNPELQQKTFNYSYTNSPKYPTNSQFIATVADRLSIDLYSEEN